MVCHPDIPIRVHYENQAHTDGPPETTLAAFMLIPFAWGNLCLLSTTFIISRDKPTEFGPAASRPACFLGFFLRARSSPAQAPSHAPVIFYKESAFALKTGVAACPGGALVRLRGAPAGVPRSSSLVIHLSTIDMETTYSQGGQIVS